MIFLLALLIPYGVCILAQDFTVTQILSGSGLYYSQVGAAKISDLKWKILTYIDLKTFEQSIFILSSYELKLKQFFTKYNRYIHYHEKQFVQYKNRVIEIQSKFDHIFALLATKRERRGLFNIPGTEVKYLTGIPDSDDALYYNAAIKEFEDNHNKSELLMNQQIQIVSNTISKFNDSIQQYYYQLNDNFVKLNNLTAQISKLGTEFEISNLLHGIISTLHLVIMTTVEQLDTLLNSIVFAKQNILHPQILKPSTLFTQLEEITYSLPSEREFPIPLTAHNEHLLLEISTLQVYFSDRKLVFILIIPLTEVDTFDLFHLYPLPISIKEHLYQVILPDYEFLLITKDRQTYVQFQNISENCKLIFPKEYLCNIKSAFSRNDRNTCEILLLQEEQEYIPKNCNIKFVNQEIFLWQKLPNNNWLISTSSISQEITLNCRNKNIEKFLIVNTNIVHLERNCVAYISNIKLLSEAVQQHNIIDIIPNISFQQQDYCQITHPKELIISCIETSQPINLKLEDLKNSQQQLHQYGDNVHKILLKHINCYPIHYVLSTSIIIFIFTICLYKCCLTACCSCLGKCCNSCNEICTSNNSRNQSERESVKLQHMDESSEEL